MTSDFVIPWADLDTYLHECEERTISAMAESADEKSLWREQGKLLLIRELLNLKLILTHTDEHPAKIPNPRLLTRVQWSKDHGLSVGKDATG